MGFVNLRSSFARVGLSLPPTIVDKGFKGQLTLHLIGGSFPIRLYAGDRLFHIILAKLASDSISYGGVYLGQRGVTYPKF
jgi:dCTP deaminase